jgi:hypothetical protein
MRWPWVAWWKEREQARDRDREATEQLAVSRELLREDHENLAQPLARVTQRNMFSDMIRDALVEGYHHAPHSHGGGKA